MEVATSTAKPLPRIDEEARRIIAAMRDSVGKRGAAGSTFDHVARQAGVSRGLLHYYFGSKERLLVEVVRHDCEVRNRNMDERLARASTADEILEALVAGLNEFLEDDQGGQAVIYEMLSASRHSDEIRAELAVYQQWRERLAGWLRLKEEEGAIALDAPRGRGFDAVRARRRLRDTGSRGSGMGPGPHLRARRRDGALDARIAAGKLSPGHLFLASVSGRKVSGVNALPSWEQGAGDSLRGRPSPDPGLDRRSRGGRSHPPGARARARAAPAPAGRSVVAFCLLGEGVAFTAHGRAVALESMLASAERVVPVEVRVERAGPPRRRAHRAARRRPLALARRGVRQRRGADRRWLARLSQFLALASRAGCARSSSATRVV